MTANQVQYVNTGLATMIYQVKEHVKFAYSEFLNIFMSVSESFAPHQAVRIYKPF